MDEEKVTEGTQNNQPESKGLSIASMVLGIVSLVFFCVWYIAIPCAILAIIFGIIGSKRGAKKMAKAGLIMGIVSVSIFVLVWILALMGVASFTTAIL